MFFGVLVTWGLEFQMTYPCQGFVSSWFDDGILALSSLDMEWESVGNMP